jgi:FMN phosphatase YigB (HAD superfamily)
MRRSTPSDEGGSPTLRRHLLLDLDGTLLGIRMGVFIPRLMSTILEHFTPFMPSTTFFASMKTALEAMLENEDPSRTVMEAFLETFAGLSGMTRGEVEKTLTDFYEGPFRELSVMAHPVDGVGDLLDAARKEDFGLTLATNPLFPIQAIRERIRWAGMDEARFDLITSAEIMHYCKPNPAYFREIVEKLGTEPGRCFMVGNDLVQDMAAGEAGIRTFLVDGEYVVGNAAAFKPDHRGSLSDLIYLLPTL